MRFLGRAGAGLDNVDVDYLAKKNIAVLHAAEGNKDAVGEFTIGILLTLLRNIAKADAEVRNTIWDREGNRGGELMGKNSGHSGIWKYGPGFR